MRSQLDRATGFGRDVVDVVQDENVTFLAGSIAYNAFVSLVPLVLLALVTVAVIGSPALERMVVGAATSVAPSLERLIQNQLFSGEATGLSIVGGLTLLWGSLKLFRGLDTAFSEIYSADVDDGLVDQVTDGLVVLIAIVAAIATTVLATLALSLFSFVPFIQYLDSVLLLAGLVLAFLPMYYVFPDVEVTVREILPGVVFAAIGWTALQGLFQVYLVVTGKDGTVDVFTSVLVLITWLYFSGLVLLVGAVINAVRGQHAEQALAEEVAADEPLDRETVAAYLETLGQAFSSGEREAVSDVSVSDPDNIELEQDEFVFGPEGRESTQQVTVRWTDRSDRSDPADD